MLLPVYLVTALLTVCSEGRSHKRKASKVDRTCNTNQFANLDSCCRTPQFFSPDLVKACIDEIGTTKPGEYISEYQTPDEFTEIKEFLSGAGGPMIAVDCMFRNQSLVFRSGRFKGDEVVQYFLNKSPPLWQELMNFTLEQCAHKLHDLNASQILEQEYANIAPALLMSCMRRLLFINCPQSARENTDASCEAKLDAVKKCGAFTLSSGDEGDSGGWMRGLLRWMVGPQTWGSSSVRAETPKSFFLSNLLHVPMSIVFPLG